MSGIFGVVSEKNCVEDVFYGTDYHSHLGTERGGMAVFDGSNFKREIHDISKHPFRSRLENFARAVKGRMGIGVISDYEEQPLIINSHLGNYAIIHVGKVRNLNQLVDKAHRKKSTYFSPRDDGSINPTQLIASLISEERSFVDGIEKMWSEIEGSSSLMLLTGEGIYVARDKYGRTPIVVGRKMNSEIEAMAGTLETTAFPNLGFKIERFLGAGEIGIISEKDYEQLKPGSEHMQICSFLWIYFGYPASRYEEINVECMRYRCGEIHGERDEREGLKLDLVAGIPDSGTGHAIGYANKRKIPYGRPFVKYTPTWPRSFMPQEQNVRDIVAKMKLIPIPELIEGKRLLFCEDSIVRGTQLKDTIQRLWDAGAKEIHMRPACPPLTYACQFLNFSRSKTDWELAARKAIERIEKRNDVDIAPYLDENSEKYKKMVEEVRMDLRLTTLRYQRLEDLVKAIGLPRERLCLGCWR